MASSTSVDDYLATLPADRRRVVEDMRRTVRAAAPEATETIAYDMPALRSHGGRFLVSYAAYKNHYSLFPANTAVVAALGAAVRPYLAGKGTLRFRSDRPVPLALVTKVVKVRLEEMDIKEAG